MAASETPLPSTRSLSDGELEKSFEALDKSTDDADDNHSACRQARAARAAALAAADVTDDSDDAQSSVTVKDFGRGRGFQVGVVSSGQVQNCWQCVDDDQDAAAEGAHGGAGQ